eukprot:8983600-Heterocapsa_arctica.AAC.1
MTAAQRRWHLCSADVSAAFLKGISFEKYAEKYGGATSASRCRRAAFLFYANFLDTRCSTRPAKS